MLSRSTYRASTSLFHNLTLPKDAIRYSRSWQFRAFPSASLRKPFFPPGQSRHFSRTPLRTQRGKQTWDFEEPEYRLKNAKPLFTNDGFGRVARSSGTRTVMIVAFAGACIFYFSNIETVPVSGRRRFNAYSQETVEMVAEEQAKRMIYDLERQGGRFLNDHDPRTRMVKRVMERLIPVSGMEDANWEVRVIDDPRQANAFVLPGGKVFVFSGLLPIARNEDGLATVLGHEIAHNLAQHAGERMSGQIGINILLGSLVLITAVFGGAILGTQIFGSQLLDVVFGRPMGRKQESEADFIGLMMMAEACYDPREAIEFWKRMGRAQEVEPPQWLSTHPSNENRIDKITEWMPKALSKAEQSDCSGTWAFANMFRRAMADGVIVEGRPVDW